MARRGCSRLLVLATVVFIGRLTGWKRATEQETEPLHAVHAIERTAPTARQDVLDVDFVDIEDEVELGDVDGLELSLSRALRRRDPRRRDARRRGGDVQAMTKAHSDHGSRVAKGNPRTVIYNRVPQCESTTMQFLIGNLAPKNNFTYFTHSNFLPNVLNIQQQQEMVNLVSNASETKPRVFERPEMFVNFENFYRPQPIYINLIRDPYDRLVSHYDYDRLLSPASYEHPTDVRNKTFDECMRLKLPLCTLEHFDGYYKIIPRFCGMEDECLVPSEYSLNKAKRNVMRYYTVVGVTEELTKFIEVLEKMLPKYFRGVTELHRSMGHKLNQTNTKYPVSAENRKIMMKRLAFDYHFYAFVQGRFHKQYKVFISENRSYFGELVQTD